MMVQTVAPAFAGFEPNGGTSVPDEVFDDLATVLSWDESKVLMYIIRRTRGFGKISDTISLTQFTEGIVTKDGRVLDKGCGVKNRARVSTVLKSLEKSGYIKIERPETKTGLITYSLRYKARDASVPSESDTRDATVPSTRDASVPTSRDATVPSTRYASVPHNKQLTIDREQDTVIQESDAIASSPTLDFDIASPKVSTQPAKTTRSTKTREQVASRDLLAEAPAEVQAIVQEWRSAFRDPIAVTEALIKAATTLAAFQPREGEILACRSWMYKNDTKNWYRNRGLSLGHVVNEFEKFRSLANIPEPSMAQPASSATRQVSLMGPRLKAPDGWSVKKPQLSIAASGVK